MEVKVKICGITRMEDIEIVNKLLPDYVGFVFAPSKRMITPEKACELIANLDKRIRKVGVFVNCDPEQVKIIARKCNLDVLQFHGDEQYEYCLGFEQEVWKAVGVVNLESLSVLETYKVDGFVLDSMVDGKSGGTGQVFDWGLVEGITSKYKIILAGGLTPSNVKNAIRRVKPFCVDVSSGVETDGKKDPEKVEKFIKAVKESEEI